MLFYFKGTALGQQGVALIAKQAVSQLAVDTNSQQVAGQFMQEPVTQITQIPWGHNIAIILELSEQFKESDQLEIEIKKNLKGLGYPL